MPGSAEVLASLELPVMLLISEDLPTLDFPTMAISGRPWPGKTRLVNLFLINEAFFLVDLPGYGFAKAPKQEKQKWADMIEGYLRQSRHLKRVFQLVDVRHAPTEDDQLMVEYLRHYDIPFTVVATKADKLSKAQRSRSIPVICRTLAVQPWEVMAHSSRDGTGRDRLLELIEAELAPPETGEAAEVGADL